jgi:hypothetical protein
MYCICCQALLPGVSNICFQASSLSAAKSQLYLLSGLSASAAGTGFFQALTFLAACLPLLLPAARLALPCVMPKRCLVPGFFSAAFK